MCISDESPLLTAAADTPDRALSGVTGSVDYAGWSIQYHDLLDSTNKEASRQLEKGGLSERTVIAAHNQQYGQGRFSRRWHARAGSCLTFSAVTFVPATLELPAQSTLVAAVAVAEAVSGYVPVAPMIKWPNDILLDGRKCCGILTELGAYLPEKDVYPVIIGIGLNVNQQFCDFPLELSGKATSLACAAGRLLPVDVLLKTVVRSLGLWLDRWHDEGFAPVRDAWLRHNHTLGRRITVPDGAESVSGIVTDLNDDGSLQLHCDDGTLLCIDSGEICFSEASVIIK